MAEQIRIEVPVPATRLSAERFLKASPSAPTPPDGDAKLKLQTPKLVWRQPSAALRTCAGRVKNSNGSG
jgi:hypothetical protein